MKYFPAVTQEAIKQYAKEWTVVKDVVFEGKLVIVECNCNHQLSEQFFDHMLSRWELKINAVQFGQTKHCVLLKRKQQLLP